MEVSFAQACRAFLSTAWACDALPGRMLPGSVLMPLNGTVWPPRAGNPHFARALDLNVRAVWPGGVGRQRQRSSSAGASASKLVASVAMAPIPWAYRVLDAAIPHRPRYLRVRLPRAGPPPQASDQDQAPPRPQGPPQAAGARSRTGGRYGRLASIARGIRPCSCCAMGRSLPVVCSTSGHT